MGSATADAAAEPISTMQTARAAVRTSEPFQALTSGATAGWGQDPSASGAYPSSSSEAGDVIETQHLCVPDSVRKRHTRSMGRSERDPTTRTVLDAATAT